MQLLIGTVLLAMTAGAQRATVASAAQSKTDSILLSHTERLEGFAEMNLLHAVESHLQLWARRGAPNFDWQSYRKLFRFDLDDVARTLEQWRSAGAIIYTLHADSLVLIYIGSGRRDTSIRRVTAAELQRLQMRLHDAIGQHMTGTAARGVRKKEAEAKQSVASLAEEAAHLLLPEKFPLDSLQHLVLIPTFNIGSFPFACLPIKKKPLIERMSYSIAPSVMEFVLMGFNENVPVREDLPESRDMTNTTEYLARASKYAVNDSARWSEHNGKVLLVGAPVNSGSLTERFTPLPGAHAELLAASRQFPKSELLLSEKATKAKVLAAMGNAQLVYFATHAVADIENPMAKSYILLSGGGDSAILTTREIQATKMAALLVVLSACETGVGLAHAGGTIGLARAFEIAGARNVLMSLWEISDGRTPELMSLFLKHLVSDGKGQDYFPYEAWRRAVLEYKNKQPDPYYWAGFSMFGVPI